jgi:hypothetical protein
MNRLVVGICVAIVLQLAQLGFGIYARVHQALAPAPAAQVQQLSCAQPHLLIGNDGAHYTFECDNDPHDQPEKQPELVNQ